MSQTVRLKALDGSPVEFVDAPPMQGGVKDVYFSPDRSYVVAFYRKPQDFNSRDRLSNIVGRYREGIFNQVGGDFWRGVFCWPTHLVEHKGRLGFKAPAYPSHFFFSHGSRNNDALGIRGKEKEGKWFSTGTHQQKWLDERERGTWLDYLRVCIRIARGVGRLHSAGLAHSDLSYKNVLIDPLTGNAAVIDIDGLVVPGKFAPDVVGTPDFIAPEVVATLSLPIGHPSKALPRIETDRHALAVLIYMYLLFRHPLKGGIVHPAATEEERMSLEMGSKALFVEHPTDLRNRPNLAEVKKSDLPFADVAKLPYGLTGPYLKALFDRAFVTGLHNPAERPSAAEWVMALVRTVDLVQPCTNPSCFQKWYTFDNSSKPRCPFCSTPYSGLLPVLNLYSSRGSGSYRPDNHRVMVYSGQYLYPWHSNSKVFPSERLTEDEKKPVGYFSYHQGKWLFVNQRLTGLRNMGAKRDVPVGTAVELTEGLQLLLDPSDGGRLVQTQLVKP